LCLNNYIFSFEVNKCSLFLVVETRDKKDKPGVSKHLYV
jgi:hypothetical protein